MSAPPQVDSPASELPAAEVHSEASPGQGWRRAVLSGLTVWGAAAAAYLLVNCLVWTLRSEVGPPISSLLDVWNRWDTGHYVTIATSGYGDAGSQSTAFFPLYPLLMRVLDPVLPGGVFAAGLIVSHAACVASLIVLIRLVDDLFGQAVARRAAFYLMAYPFAFYLVAAYNESLFLALTVGALYCMRRGSWWFAGVLGALASATRLAGVLLGLAFVVEYLRQHPGLMPFRPRSLHASAAAVALIPVGVLAFAVYCWQRFDDPLQFMSIQETWGRHQSWPWDGLAKAVGFVVDGGRGGAVFQPIVVLNMIDILALITSVAMLVLTVAGRWRLGRESAYLVVFSIASLAIAVSSPLGNEVPLHGLPRYALELVAVFIVAARMGASEVFDRFYLSIGWALQGVLLTAFFFDLWLS